MFRVRDRCKTKIVTKDKVTTNMWGYLLLAHDRNLDTQKRVKKKLEEVSPRIQLLP